jgi:hypothetical protein
MKKYISKLIRKIQYRTVFNNNSQAQNIMKGLNPDKHNQMFESWFNADENQRGNI